MAEVKGIVGRKVGMTQVFEEGHAVPVTMVEAGPCRIAQIKRPETDGYSALQLAFGAARKSPNKPVAGHYEKAGVEPGSDLIELRVDDLGSYEVGGEIRADVFEPGELVDVIGVTKGKGFAGGMKRHHFAGLSASHGTERKHRSPGSVGAAATPSRVFKGTRMAGHMGHSRVTTLNLKVIKVEPERNLLLVRGAVPGPKGGLVMVRSAIRLRRRDERRAG